MAVQVRNRTGSTIVDTAAVEAFISSIHGAVIQPGDDGYDDARAIQNGLIDRRPALIVRASGPADVIAAVSFARDNDLLLAVRGGGHNVAGNAVCDGGVVVDLTRMRSVRVDPAARTARAEGGATWGELDRETQVFGLAAPGGIVSTTGIAGLTMHGGMGHLRRKYGLSLDNLRSVDIVTADGQLRVASATENPDLFWAVRGAGPNFGVVTSFEFDLHPVGPETALCAVAYALDDADDVIRAWRSFMATAPEEVSSLTLFWSVPAVPGFPEDLWNMPIVIVVALYAGDADEGERQLMPLRQITTPVLDLSGIDHYAHIQNGFDGFFPKGSLYYWKSLNVRELSDELIEAVRLLAGERPSPRTTIDIWDLSGAVQRVPADATAYGQRDAPYMIAVESSWDDPSMTDRNIAWTREAIASLQRFGTGGSYLNFPGFGEEREALLRGAYGANYDRLIALKEQYDPTNLFRMNLNLRRAPDPQQRGI